MLAVVRELQANPSLEVRQKEVLRAPLPASNKKYK